MEERNKKQAFRQRLISIIFILQLVWTVAWTALAVTLIVLGITDGNSDMFIGAIPVGIFAIIGLIFFVPMCIHRKKIIFKDGMIITHAPSKKRYELLLGIWKRKDETFSLTGITPHFEGRILNFSWKRGWQKIDLTQITEINEWQVSLTPNAELSRHERDMGKNSVFRNRLVKYLVLTVRHKGHLIVELTNFKDNHQQKIMELLESRGMEGKTISSTEQEREDARKLLDVSDGDHSLWLSEKGEGTTMVMMMLQELTGRTPSEITQMLKELPCMLVDNITREDAMRLADRISSSWMRARTMIRSK